MPIDACWLAYCYKVLSKLIIIDTTSRDLSPTLLQLYMLTTDQPLLCTRGHVTVKRPFQAYYQRLTEYRRWTLYYSANKYDSNSRKFAHVQTTLTNCVYRQQGQCHGIDHVALM